MRILFLCTKYPVVDGETYMTSELALALKAAGHSVDIILLDWDAVPGSATETLTVEGGVPVIRIAPRAWTHLGTLVYRASKFILSYRHAVTEATRYYTFEDYDMLVAWMPATSIGGLLRKAKQAKIAKRILFIWDFYPIHHMEIGMIPKGPVYLLAKKIEDSLLATLTHFVTLMPQNMDYLQKNYRITSDQSILWTPIWTDLKIIVQDTDRFAIRTKYGLPENSVIAVFGGQITDGRGIETLLASAEHCRISNPPVHFLFVGNGRLAASVQDRSRISSNVHYTEAMPRKEYLRVLSACDIGLVATVPGVSSFTFPSKILDYLRIGVPIIAAIEAGNQYRDLIDQYQLGQNTDFDARRIATAVSIMAGNLPEPDALKVRAQAFLKEWFDVRRAVSAIQSCAD